MATRATICNSYSGIVGVSNEQPRLYHGHGSIYRGTSIALQHVGYSLAETYNEGMTMTGGVVRGDPHVLRPMATMNEPLTLVLEDGRRLSFRLRNARLDGVSWEISAFGLPR